MTHLAHIDTYDLSTHASIDAFGDAAWQTCVGPNQPYLDPRHLRALETSGLIGVEAGTLPTYLALKDADGTLQGAAPVFLKTHSSGELGVDWGLPLAHDRVAGPYYPKLTVEVPLTPWAGPRLLVAGAKDQNAARRALLSGLDALVQQVNASSVQIGYGTKEDQTAAQAHGYLPVETTTFTWRSRGEQDFDAFKASQSKRGRYRLRAEYERLVADGLVIKRLDGADLTPDVLARIFELYCAVFKQHKHGAWLNYAYFETLVTTMPGVIEFSGVWDGDQLIAGLFFFLGGDKMIGQHWVAEHSHQGLLFALMYQSYRDAIERGYQSVDYGPIGAHKAYRAAIPEPLYHALKFADATFQGLAETVLAKRATAQQAEMAAFAFKSPYKDKGRVE